jgi:uncharacterized Zn finger protein
MSWYSFRPYVSVAERRRKAAAAAKKMSKKGRALAPVNLATKKIATTFWGKAWCDNLEAYSDFANRLPRGRSYVRNGSVIDLQITVGKVEAHVQGSSLYKIAIGFKPLAPKRWADFKARSAGKVTNLLDLLQGRLSMDILADITAHEAGLFPAPKEIELGCSCPDWADMCKHVAAVLYGVGARLDEKPDLFFTLRGVAMDELITAASASATSPIGDASATAPGIEDTALSEIFGVEIETAPVSAPASVGGRGKPARKTSPAKPAAKAGRKPSAISGQSANAKKRKTKSAARQSAKKPAKKRAKKSAKKKK